MCTGLPKAAWKHHHKFECETFQSLIATGTEPVLQITELRLLIRILRLHDNKKISDAEWAGFLSLPDYKEPVTKSNPHLKQLAASCTAVAKEFSKTSIDTDAIEYLFYLASTLAFP